MPQGNPAPRGMLYQRRVSRQNGGMQGSGCAVQKIVSGGQTGVDQAALDVAIFCDIPHGGWCPRGRRSEDGPIPSRFQLRELPSSDYAQRTEQNVRDSDGTLILYRGALRGGTRLTARFCRTHRRPFRTVDLSQISGDLELAQIALEIREWLNDQNVNVLNVAGPRESSAVGVGEEASRLLIAVFAPAC